MTPHTHTVKLNPRNKDPNTHMTNAVMMKSMNTCTGCQMGRQEGIRCCIQRFSGRGREGEGEGEAERGGEARVTEKGEGKGEGGTE